MLKSKPQDENVYIAPATVSVVGPNTSVVVPLGPKDSNSPKRKKQKTATDPIAELIALARINLQYEEYGPAIGALNDLVKQSDKLSTQHTMSLITLYKDFVFPVRNNADQDDKFHFHQAFKKLCLLPPDFKVLKKEAEADEDFKNAYSDNKQFLIVEEFKKKFREAETADDYSEVVSLFYYIAFDLRGKFLEKDEMRSCYIELAEKIQEIDSLTELQKIADFYIKVYVKPNDPFYLAQYYTVASIIEDDDRKKLNYIFPALQELKKQLDHSNLFLNYKSDRNRTAIKIHDQIIEVEIILNNALYPPALREQLNSFKEDLKDSLSFGWIDYDKRTFNDWLYIDYEKYHSKEWIWFIKSLNGLTQISRESMRSLELILKDNQVDEGHKNRIKEKLKAMSCSENSTPADWTADYDSFLEQKSNAQDQEVKEKINKLEQFVKTMTTDTVSPRDIYTRRLISLYQELFCLYQQQPDKLSEHKDMLTKQIDALLSKGLQSPHIISAEVSLELKKAKALFSNKPVGRAAPILNFWLSIPITSQMTPPNATQADHSELINLSSLQK